MTLQKITPFLWYDNQAEEAANFYITVFPNSKIHSTSHYDEAGAKVSGMPAGSVLVVEFELEGQTFQALNGGPIFKFNESISFVVHCESQNEIDQYWEKLSAVPESEQCGWLKDKFGVSWQIVPRRLAELLSDPDKEKSGRVMQAMLQMKKIEVSKLENAYRGE
jgi:predicted 3-demethylubiquinone-9 3-methyltransferase (glyoxalase superfamily)